MAAKPANAVHRAVHGAPFPKNQVTFRHFSVSKPVLIPPGYSKRQDNFLTSSILAHLESGDLPAAVSALSSSPSHFPASVYARIVHLCSAHRAIPETRRVEAHILAHFHSPPTFIFNRVIEAYGQCGSLHDARELFDKMPYKNGGTWNSIITAYANANQPKDAIFLFCRMHSSGVRPKDVTFASVLRCCADFPALFLAKQAHCLIVKGGFSSNVILGTSLVDVYGKCWTMDDAKKMFDSIANPNSVSWNVIIRRYLEAGNENMAIIMFSRMVATGNKPLSFTVSNALLACTEISGLWEGCQIHATVIKKDFTNNNVIECSLMEMYATCGFIDKAQLVFDESTSRDVVSWTLMISLYAGYGKVDEAESLFSKMPERNIVSWNAMLTGYVLFFFWEKALNFFHKMQIEFGDIDEVTLVMLLKVCSGTLNLKLGKEAHGFAYRHGLYTDLFLGNALLNMYTKCGSFQSAELWFLNMASQRDEASWNSLLYGYARYGQREEATNIFGSMLNEMAPSEVTLVLMLMACANVSMLKNGMQIHAYMIRHGFDKAMKSKGALIDMYCKCRSMDYALNLFTEESLHDLVTWNMIILGLAHNERGKYSLELFELMQRKGLRVDDITFIGVFVACINDGLVDLGKEYFRRMSDEFDISPHAKHYECMIEFLGRHGFMSELEAFILQIPFQLTIDMWNRILDHSREHGSTTLQERATISISEYSSNNSQEDISMELFIKNEG